MAQNLKPTKELEDTVKYKLKNYEDIKAKEAEKERMRLEIEKQKKLEEENKRRREEAEQKAKDEAEVMGVDEKEIEVEKIEEATVEDIDVEQPLPTIDKVKGLGIRRNWKARVIDKSKIPIEYLEPNMVALNGLARSLKDKFNISGVEAYED